LSFPNPNPQTPNQNVSVRKTVKTKTKVANPNNSNQDLSVVGCKVNDETKAMLQDYANKLSQEYLLDPVGGIAKMMHKKFQGFNIIIIVMSGITAVYLAYPLLTILMFVKPSMLLNDILRPQVTDALVMSLVSASISTSILCLFGIPLSYFLARFHNFPGKILLRVVVIIPLVLPPLASGALLLGVFGPYSPMGKAFPGVEFTQSIVGIIIAQTYVASPFMILSSQAAFESVDESYENVARVLGRSRIETFFRISLPLAKSGIVIGIILSWVRAVGELGATMMMAYNPHTISIQIFEDNAIGGLRTAIPDIVLAIGLSIIAIFIVYITRREQNQKDALKLQW
jgi:molybdate/tungstate transport system permease protein